jgi:hypothetical protein
MLLDWAFPLCRPDALPAVALDARPKKSRRRADGIPDVEMHVTFLLARLDQTPGRPARPSKRTHSCARTTSCRACRESAPRPAPHTWRKCRLWVGSRQKRSARSSGRLRSTAKQDIRDAPHMGRTCLRAAGSLHSHRCLPSATIACSSCTTNGSSREAEPRESPACGNWSSGSMPSCVRSSRGV